MELVPLLKRLTMTAGVSGFEGGIREVVQEVWSPLVDETWIDTMGNLIGLKLGQGTEPRRKLMIAAHMDEIGLMVTHINQSFLSVTNVGNIYSGLLMGQRVVVHGRRDLYGLLGSRPPHLLTMKEREKLVQLDELVVDMGLPEKDVKEFVHIGDPISFYQELQELMCGRVTAKALDNRASIAALIICLEILQKRYHEWDILVVATVQEEVTLAGAYTSTYSLQPDVGIAVDVIYGKSSDVKSPDTFSLSEGPVIGYGPNNHPDVNKRLVETAEAIELAYQIRPDPKGRGTDAWAIEVVRSGVPTAAVMIPLRNMHSPVEVVELNDIRRMGSLLAEFTAGLDEHFIQNLDTQQGTCTEAFS